MRRSWPSWTRHPRLLDRLALASVVVNVLIVVTGGAVRLTGSGLGCPTWPKCTDDSLTPTPEFRQHGIIEFTNRQLTFVVTIVVIATLLAAISARRQRLLAVLLAASIPAQAVLGGITVLTHLNPWTVAAHFLLSMGIIAIAFVLWWRTRPDAVPASLSPTGTTRALSGTTTARTTTARTTTASSASATAGPGEASPGEAGAALSWAAGAVVAVTAAVLAVGTVVTGSGPHAGDKGATHRIHIAPSSVAQLHADLVMLLIGLTLGFALLARLAGARPSARTAIWWLLGIELGQGVIGFIQYFTHVPALLVGIHMLGACLVWLAALSVPATLGLRPFGHRTPAATSGVAAPEMARLSLR